MRGYRAVFIAAAVVLLAACTDNSDSGGDFSDLPRDFAVGMTSMTFIDTTRETAAHGNMPRAPTRVLETTIVYPAQGAVGSPVAANRSLSRAGAPFPLVVLAHGLGGTVEYLLPLAGSWASKGYVVAVPRFPLTHAATRGGPAAQDTQNQPGDVSFLIDEMVAVSDTPGGLLENAVDGELIAAGGHSNGGITTYGVVAHACCRDPRIDAAIVLAGVPSPFSGGEYDLTDTPPMFVVQGTKDLQINYNQAVRTYNDLLPPKGFLSLIDATHGSFLQAEDPAFGLFAQATVDFLDAVLRDDVTASEHLVENSVEGVAMVYWAPDEASNVPVETLPEPETNRQAFLSADTDLVDGQVITVTWSGFLPDTVVNVTQCAGEGRGAATCNLSGGRILYPDPLGMGSLELVIRTGPIGNGVCDSANPCTVAVNDASLTEEEATIRIPITFAD